MPEKASEKRDDTVLYENPLLTDDDLYLFNQGSHFRLYEKLGAHPMEHEGKEGAHFAVWAPDAQKVYVMGDFNGWDKKSHPLRPRRNSGIWEGFIPGVGKGANYKYHIASRFHGYHVDKADPFALYSEVPPRTGSIVWDLNYVWGDREWMENRQKQNALDAPMAIYEIHLGSWMRKPEEENSSLTYRELAPRLAEYVRNMGFTHVEFLPVMEHPFYGSWGYQTSGYFTPIHRAYHHGKLTFRMVYAFQENFVLPLSHDEVVYGKGSLLSKMPGDDWQKFANLRLLLGYMYAQPGKKLLFMGGEFGQWDEWYHESNLGWHLLKQPLHRGLQRWVQDLNQLYRNEPALHEQDFDPAGFEWIDCNDAFQSTLGMMRKARSTDAVVIAVLNFTPVPRHNYRVGAPIGGFWREALNSDGQDYGGSGQGSLGGVEASPVSAHGRPYALNVTLPPLASVFFKSRGQ